MSESKTISLTFQASGEIQQTIELVPGVEPKDVLEGLRSGSIMTSLNHDNGVGGDLLEDADGDTRRIGTVLSQVGGEIEYIDIDLIDDSDEPNDTDDE